MRILCARAIGVTPQTVATGQHDVEHDAIEVGGCDRSKRIVAIITDVHGKPSAWSALRMNAAVFFRLRRPGRMKIFTEIKLPTVKPIGNRCDKLISCLMFAVFLQRPQFSFACSSGVSFDTQDCAADRIGDF